MRNASPSNAASVPSVAMIGLTFKTVTMKPLIDPQKRPAAIPARIANGIDPAPNVPITPCVITMAENTEATLAIEPIEMSRAPPTITTVSPIASKPTITMLWARLFTRFCHDQKKLPPCTPMSGAMTLMRIIRITSAPINDRLSTPTAVTIRRRPPRARRVGAGMGVSAALTAVPLLPSRPRPALLSSSGDRPWRGQAPAPR